MSRKSILTLLGTAVLVSSAGIYRSQGQRGQVQLPDGQGREIIQANCTACHGLNQIPNSAGYSKEGWESLVSTMVALPRDQAAVVGGYLAANFPEKPGRRPTLVS
jgi:mono/diheme cytochrome c family protein